MTKVIIWDDPKTKITSVMAPAGGKTVEFCVANYLPEGITDYKIVEDSVLPTDRTFRNAWRKDGETVKEDLTESKKLAHEKRRYDRTKEFKPYDDIVMKQIPGSDTEAAEAERVKIRDKYATMQTSIDNASDTAAIKTALEVS